MRKIAGTLLLLLTMPLTHAAVINVEFKFTPFIGDPAKDVEVTTMPGKAVVLYLLTPLDPSVPVVRPCKGTLSAALLK